MKESIKEYADTLYDGARMQSGTDARRAKIDFQQQRAARSLGYTILSGPDLQKLVTIFAEHIGRCVQARFEAYEKAYKEDDSFPSDKDFDQILAQCRTVQAQEISHAVMATREFIASNGAGGVSGAHIPNESTFQVASSEYMDSTVHGWKAWKAKAQLKSASTKVEIRERKLDTLTAVLDRSELDIDLANLGSSCNESSPLSMLFMDLDKFKPINDGLGHDAGDRALQAFARALMRVADRKGTVYRCGGDEFCMLLPNHSLEEALTVAERIRREVQAIRTSDLTNGLSTSIGAASIPESINDVAKLRGLADKAMYVSKNAGGNRVSRAENTFAAN
jgi:diguanylate cyclase (GGDEF)-like protein